MLQVRNLILGVLFVATPPAVAWSQEAPIPPSAPATVVYPARVIGNFSAIARNETDIKLQQAIEKYRNEETDSAAKEEARQEIGEWLTQRYDELLQQQEDELNKMEDKLVKLRDQLKQRRTAKQKMVDLKLEMVIAQADGLGWPEGESRNSLFYASPAIPPAMGFALPGGEEGAIKFEVDRARADFMSRERRTRN